jgi:hypothetical protein
MLRLLCTICCVVLAAAARVPDDALVQRIAAGSIISPLSHVVTPSGQAVAAFGASADSPWLATVFQPGFVDGRQLRVPEDAKSASFDPELAQTLAKLQSISYCNNISDVQGWNCTRCAAIPGFQTHLAHFDDAWDLMGYLGYWPEQDAKVLVFRGTDSSSWYNWAQNMRAWRTDTTWPVPGAPRALRIHSGFLNLYNRSSLASTFKGAFGELLQQHPAGTTYVLGHSMGGALAHLAALDLKITYQLSDVKVFTFGAPRVGNSVFADFFSQQITDAWRFTHGRDIVPSVPLQLMGFHHVSREIWLVDVADPTSTDVQQKVVVCDDSGEDPSCHNSVCHLGLCTSVADHLLYYGAHMYRGGEC